MKKLLLLFLAVMLVTVVNGSGITDATPTPTTLIKRSFSLKEFVKLTPKEYEKLTGKKLKLKDKIGLKILQWKLKRQMVSEPTKEQRKLGWLSFIFGVVALGCMFVPVGIVALLGVGLAVGGFILGLKSIKGNSNAPGIIGIVTSSIVMLVFLVAIVAVLSGAVFY